MYWDVKTVKAISTHALYVEIENGKKGIFDVSPYWNQGILKELQNPAYFNQVTICLGALTWPNGQDIAPETLLHDLQVTL